MQHSDSSKAWSTYRAKDRGFSQDWEENRTFYVDIVDNIIIPSIDGPSQMLQIDREIENINMLKKHTKGMAGDDEEFDQMNAQVEQLKQNVKLCVIRGYRRFRDGRFIHAWIKMAPPEGVWTSDLCNIRT